MTHRIIVIVGATAVGKTAISLRLARELDAEIVNADALQVYRGLDIGTDKPSSEARAAVPHHLVDILEPEEPYSAGEFARRARTAITDIQNRGKRALIVGGSGLYLRALLEGMSPIPPADPAIRRQLGKRLAAEGLEALAAELRHRDPATAARLSPGDAQRTLRALEVALSSGRPLSSWIAEKPFGERRLEAFRLGLTVPRAILYDRIARRVEEMADQGWVTEVTALLDRGVDPQAPAFQAIGYRQIVRFIAGEWNLRAALDDTIRATRRYAKRQVTWFRKERGVCWYPVESLAGALPPSLMNELELEEHRPDEQT